MDLLRKENYWQYAYYFLILLYLVALFRTAWVSDDALITYRTVLNFISGYGPTFNVDERVQAFTHPLWFLMLSGFSQIFGNVFYTSFFLSISLSLFTMWLFISRVATVKSTAILACFVLIFSRAYIDFSTSGLENPLSHFLMVLLILVYDKCSDVDGEVFLIPFFVCCSCIYLTRPDHIILILPLLFLVVLDNKNMGGRLYKKIFLGLSPAILWTSFALFYYGFPFPNTAYAKLMTGIALKERIIQGFIYFHDAWTERRMTFLILCIGIILGFNGSRSLKALAIGTLFYSLYLISIGGDFMRGRFLTTSLLIACIILARTRFARLSLFFATFLIILMALSNLNYTVWSDFEFSNKFISSRGIADERGYYFQRSCLLKKFKNKLYLRVYAPSSVSEWKGSAQSGDVSIGCAGLGAEGLLVGPKIHLVDVCGLSDPFLSHVPAKHNPAWRIGHFYRKLPKGYIDSIRQNKNLVQDEKAKSFYESIRVITRASLYDMSRLKETFKMNLGLVEPLNTSAES